MTPRIFGTLPSGETAMLYELGNAAGASLRVTNYGGIVTALRVPDRAGRLDDVVLGFDSLAPYLAGHPYFGAIIGRIAGRVTHGKLPVGGRVLQLPVNSAPHHLHGGHTGLDKRLWTASPVARADGADSLRLTYRSPDGEEGYPGKVDLAVTYTLTAENAFIVESEVTADQRTPVCLAHHSYFNLGGEGSGSVADHTVQILADERVPTDEHLTLSGRREAVAGSAADFRTPRRLGDALPQLFKNHGDTYVLRPAGQAAPVAPVVVAHVSDPRSGRVLTVSTDEDCLQFYTGVALKGDLVGKSGRAYGPHAGLCLECQGYADGASHPSFGDIFVQPGKPQRHTTVYAFSTL